MLTIAAWPALLWLESYYELPPNYAEVEPGLWMGANTDTPPPGTQVVLNLCEEEDAYRTEVYVWEPIRDAAPAPTVDWLKEKVDWVDSHHRAGRTTFVHCFQGRSRSGLVVTAYLMHKHGWTRDEALEKIREKRPEIRLNAAFLRLLGEWETHLQR